jgi:polyhydroxyalkanoate synthesis regulator phasin
MFDDTLKDGWMTLLSDSDVYEITGSEYVRKADVNEERKETRLQGLKDQLTVTERDEGEELHKEVKELENRIAELTEFKPGTQFQ